MIESPYICASCKKPIPFGVTYCPNCGESQASGTGPLWMGERRQVTVLFADLASFTSVSEKADPEDVIDMLNQVFSRLMQECDREGGYLDKTVGDQLMVLFGAPRAHEDDPARAVRAALRMQKAMSVLGPIMREKVGSAFRINIGINSGPVVWGRMGPPGRAMHTVIGDTVNLASRLQGYAKHGQIIVSETVFHQTRRLFEYQNLDAIQVKGKSGLIPIYMPLRQIETQQKSKKLEAAPILLERYNEQQALQTIWGRSLSGFMQFVIVTGQAGIGKSQLLTEFAQSIDSFTGEKTPLILRAHNEATPGSHYSPLMHLLNQLFGLTAEDSDLSRRRKVEDRARILGITSRNFVPLMGYLLGWYQNSTRLTEADKNMDHLNDSAVDAAIDLFFKQSHRRPTLLLVDDLQWSDSGTVQWINRLAILKQMMRHENMGYGLMVVLSTRPQNKIPLHTLQTDAMITLQPLSERGRHELIQHLLPGGHIPQHLLEALSRESGGNPFYLEEATRGLVQSGLLVRKDESWQLTQPMNQINVPASVEGLVMANLDTLAPTAKTVLQYASVIGQNFSLNLLQALTELDGLDAVLLELEQRGLIKEITDETEDSRRFTFTQMIVREVAYNSVLRKTRRDLHERIAAITEIKETAQQPRDVESLAYHYAAGGNQEKLVVYNWLAGQQAMERSNFKEAETHLSTAWNALREINSPEPKILRSVANALGDVSTFTGNYAQASVCYQIVKELPQDESDVAQLLYKLGRLNFFQANNRDATTHYAQALELSVSDPVLQSQIDAEIRLLYYLL